MQSVTLLADLNVAQIFKSANSVTDCILSKMQSVTLLADLNVAQIFTTFCDIIAI